MRFAAHERTFGGVCKLGAERGVTAKDTKYAKWQKGPGLTLDIDFLALEKDRDAWLAKLQHAGMNKFSESTACAKFLKKEGDGFDLIFVNGETFEPIWRRSIEQKFDQWAARIPHVDHLLALTRAKPTEARVVSLEVMIQRNADFRRWFPQSIPTEEERLASKVHEEFVL